jgi:ATP-binding cassette subfamily B protein
MAVYLLASIAGSLAAVAQPLVFRRIIDSAIPARDLGSVTTLGLVAGLIAVVSVALGVVSRWLGARIGHGLVYDMRCALFEKLLWLPQDFYTHARHGAVLSRLNSDVSGAEKAFTLLLRVLASNSVLLVVVLATMASLDLRLALAAVALFPPLVYLTHRLGRTMQNITEDYLQKTGDMNAFLAERVGTGGSLLIHLFGRRSREATEFASTANQVREAGVRQIAVARIGLALVPLSAALATGVIYTFGGRSAIGGGLSVGTLVAFAALIQRLYDPIFELADARIEISNSLVSFARVFELLDVVDSRSAASGAPMSHEEALADLQFVDVRFRYQSADTVPESLRLSRHVEGEQTPSEVLRGVSFTAPGGRTTAIVGPTGAGKTTILACVARLYRPSSGSVRLGGRDIAEISLEDYMARVAVVSQETHLFHESIRGNLLYARRDATDDELIEACRVAELGELLDRLPEGLDTVVGERGYRMSGGEKQRLALARVVLKRPAIVLLDEATAHLDSGTEARVQIALSRVLKGRTVLVVAHRLSTVRDAAQILVIENGRVVERGTDQELRAAPDGRYAMLYSHQFASR